MFFHSGPDTVLTNAGQDRHAPLCAFTSTFVHKNFMLRLRIGPSAATGSQYGVFHAEFCKCTFSVVFACKLMRKFAVGVGIRTDTA